MALKVELKPNERIILGQSVVTNVGQRTTLLIEGNAPILRQKDILRPEEADTPAKCIYLAVQIMYLAGHPAGQEDTIIKLIRDLRDAAPSTSPHIDRITNLLLTTSYYKALREIRALIAYEGELLESAKRR
ncbi:MAG: flagellar biosynthesis repressor FlbT [Alphaproteobacteria bacterium]